VVKPKELVELFFTFPSFAPYSYLTSFDASVGSSSLSLSEGFVGTAYTYISEVDANGVIVQQFPLSDFTWSSTAVTTSSSTLQYATTTGTLLGQTGFSVSFTLVVSSVVGLVSSGSTPINALVTPKSLEVILEIDGFPYTNVDNSARLTVGVATGSSELLANVSSLPVVGNSYALSVGSGLSAVYVTFASQAHVDGNKEDVNISIEVAGSADVGGLSTELFSLTSKVSCKLVNITFPAGSAKIIYDPATGTGAAPVVVASTSAGQTLYAAMEIITVLSAIALLGMRL